MLFHRCAILVLIVSVSACASSGGNDPFGQDFANDVDAARGTSTLIVRGELAEFSGDSAYRVIELLRRRWLQPRGGASLPRVVIDGGFRTDIGQLRSMSADSVEEMRFLSSFDATTLYGTGYTGGAIEVTSRGR